MTSEQRFSELWTDFLEGDLDDTGLAELQALLAADELLRARAADFFQTHRLLGFAFQDCAATGEAFLTSTLARVPLSGGAFVAFVMERVRPVPQGPGSNPGRPLGRLLTRAHARSIVMAGTGVLVLCVVAASIWLRFAPPQPNPPESFATLTRTNDCVWEEPARARRGDRLGTNPLKLREGAAEITLASGVRLLVEAPAHFALVDANNSSLHSGRIVMRSPPMAAGFAIETPHGRFVDIGTEFGVSVEPDRETIVQVFDGIVMAELKHADAVGERRRRLVAGEAIRIEGSGGVEMQNVFFSHERFLRTFYAPNVHEGDELIPFKLSQMSSLDVAAAPDHMNIDGRLSEWDLPGMFKAHCAEPFAESHYVFGSLMYDEQNLYVAARVGDPTPLQTVMDPATAGQYAWAGGSVELRLSTDRTLGWPVQAVKPSQREGSPLPQDTSGRIVHLTLWYFKPRAQPCLQIQYGMDLDRKVVNPPGWSGVFRKAADGTSYTLEYAIPWSLLGAGGDPPRAGDELGLCWIVNWSDASGRRWRGQLIENKNPLYAGRGEKFLTFMFAETWGKAIYQ